MTRGHGSRGSPILRKQDQKRRAVVSFAQSAGSYHLRTHVAQVVSTVAVPRSSPYNQMNRHTGYWHTYALTMFNIAAGRLIILIILYQRKKKTARDLGCEYGRPGCSPVSARKDHRGLMAFSRGAAQARERRPRCGFCPPISYLEHGGSQLPKKRSRRARPYAFL